MTSVPQWISSIGASISLILALYIILRDRRKNEREQASGIAAWQTLLITHHLDRLTQEPSSAPAESRISVENLRVVVHNCSDMPVTHLGLFTRPMTPKELHANFTAAEMTAFGISSRRIGLFEEGSLYSDNNESVATLLPGDKARNAEKSPITDGKYFQPLNAHRRWVQFVDSTGITWFRDLSNGELLRAHSLRTRQVLRGQILPVPDFEVHFRKIIGETGPLSLSAKQAILIARLAYGARRWVNSKRD
jgi:hypothetical protein